MGTMSQQKRPHKRYTPKFFHCDDVPRQTTSSDMTELVSVTEIPLATNVGHSKPENILSEYLALWVKCYRSVSRVIYANPYNFVIAVWRAKEAE